jgi:hypothetical protein
MKRWIIAALCTLALTACGSEESTKTTAQEEKPTTAQKQEVPPEAKGTVEEDGFIKYRSAEWHGEFNDLKINVNGVSVTNDVTKALEIEDAEPNVRGVFVWITTDNTTDKEFYSTLSTANLVTSSREQASPDVFLSDDFPLEIVPNAKTDGDLAYILKSEDDVKNIKSITLNFEITDQKTYETKKFNVNLPLK